MNQSHSGRDINEFVLALDNGERIFRMLHLEHLDGVSLNLRECDLQGSRFKEARLGHANLSNAVLHGCCFQQVLLWGSELEIDKSYLTKEANATKVLGDLGSALAIDVSCRT